MATWSVWNGNSELALTGRAPFDLVSIQNIGSAPVRRLEERSPFQDGVSDVGFRLDPRTINLVVYFAAANRATADGYRDQLHSYFKGLSRPLALRCVRDDGATRQIDCYPIGLIDAPVDDQNRIGASQRMAVQLRAPDPIWYDPAGASVALLGGSSTGASGFGIPMAVPWVQATQTLIDRTFTIAYPGTWAEYPIITVYGPATNVTITNETTGDVLDFPSLVLTAGQYVQVDLRYGYKTVVDQAGASQIAKLSSDSDLATWRLAAAPEAAGGANVIHFEVASTANNDTGVTFQYYNRYAAA